MARVKTSSQRSHGAKQLAEAQALAEARTQEAIQGLLAIANDAKVAATARVAAYSEVLDRVLGRPGQASEAAGQVDPMVLLDDAQREAENARLLADLRRAVGEKRVNGLR